MCYNNHITKTEKKSKNIHLLADNDQGTVTTSVVEVIHCLGRSTATSTLNAGASVLHDMKRK